MRRVQILGMSCAHCAATAALALESLGLREVTVSLEAGMATFAPADLDPGLLRAALDDAGFETGEIV